VLYIPPEGSEMVMTLADILREEGKKEGIKTVAHEILKIGLSIHFVAEVIHMGVKGVKRLKEEVQ